MGRDEHDRQPVLVGERVGRVGVDQPHLRALRRRAQAAPVAPVEEAPVRLHAARHARPARDLRVAPVGRDDELRADLTARVRVIFDPHAGRARVAEQPDRGPARDQLHAGRLRRQPAQQWVERASRHAEAVGRVWARRRSSRSAPSTRRPRCARRHARRAVAPGRARSIVGVALDWMKCVQTVLYASGEGLRSISATRAPRCA